jgi:hypothetical protein
MFMKQALALFPASVAPAGSSPTPHPTNTRFYRPAGAHAATGGLAAQRQPGREEKGARGLRQSASPAALFRRRAAWMTGSG